MRWLHRLAALVRTLEVALGPRAPRSTWGPAATAAASPSSKRIAVGGVSDVGGVLTVLDGREIDRVIARAVIACDGVDRVSTQLVVDALLDVRCEGHVAISAAVDLELSHIDATVVRMDAREAIVALGAVQLVAQLVEDDLWPW